MVGLLGKYLESSLALPYEEDQERSGLVKECVTSGGKRRLRWRGLYLY
jgi:hypothetical protein